MPLYFFHVNELELGRDTEGLELPDVHAAWSEATKHLGDLLKHMAGDLRPDNPWSVQVNDEFQNTLLEIHIKPVARVSLNGKRQSEPDSTVPPGLSPTDDD